MIQAKIEYSKNGPNDEFYTPDVAIEMILPFIPKSVSRIWECTAIDESRIVKILRENGYTVIATHKKEGFDFLNFEPSDYDLNVTNPPFSLKDKFLKRAFALGKPFMFLLPLTTLEGKERSGMFQKNQIQLLIPDERFNFKTGKNSGAWFQTSWFTYGLGFEHELNFIPISSTGTPRISRSEKFTSIYDLYNEIYKAA